MASPSALHIAADRVVTLRNRELALRQAGRLLEVDPAMKEEADRLFARADEVRRERVELAKRCGLDD